MADDAPTSTVQAPSADVSASSATRRSQRAPVPSERVRTNADVEEEDTSTITVGERGQNSKPKRAVVKTSNSDSAAAVERVALVTLVAKPVELTEGVAKLQKQNGLLMQVVRQNESKMAGLAQQNEALLQAVKESETKIAALEAQNQRLTEIS